MAKKWRLTAVELVGVGIMMICFAAPAQDRAVLTPFVLREDQIDTSSVESIIASIIRPGMNDKEKAFAVYNFLRNHVYHWPAMREPPKADDFEYGVVYDPVKLVNVYGYGYCFANRGALEALWQAAGLEARSAGIGGHSIAEVFYEGAYHFLDADQHGYILLPDGKTVASIAQIERDPINLIIKQPNPSDPFFPATADPKVPYESKVILAGYFASTEDNYYQHDKIVRGHTMDITLLPGMRFVRRFTGDGRWNIRNKDLDMEYKLGYVDPRVGPRDFLTDTTYANGELLYQPDLTTHSEEYPAGVWQEANILRTDRGLQPAEGGKESWSVFRIRLPYAIVGWPTSFTGPANPVGAAAISVVLHRGSHAVRQGIGISVDAGASWRTIWTNDATGTVEQAFDFSQLVVGRYEYLVRIELTASNPAESRLERLAINTAFQVAPRVLPALREGENRMIFRLGTQTETTEIIPNLSNADSFLRHVVSYNGVWLTDSSIMSRLGRQGEVVFELAPPKPGTVHRFSVNAGCRREPAQRHPDDDIKIYYAENEPRDWKLLYDDEYPSWAGHWGYFAYGDAVCRPDTKRVFVRFAITTGSSAAIRHIVMRLHWRPEGAGGMPPRGVKVEHGWTEGGIPKMYSHVCTRPVEKYTVKVGTAVENSYVLLEPVRASGLVWRPNDPPVHKPPTPTNEVVDVAMRDEMRSLLRAIDKDPVSALPIAAKSKIEWLAGAAKQALEMIQKFGWK